MSRARDVANYGDGIDTSSITSGTFADARIAASNVTQHEGSIDALASNPTITLGTNATGFTGPKVVDQWWVHTDTSSEGSSQILASGWGRPAVQKLGDGTNALIGGSTKFADPSSGKFAFPLTGIWHISYTLTQEANGGARTAIGFIQISVDNGGSFADCAMNYASHHANDVYATININVVLDITDISGGDAQLVQFGWGNTTSNGMIAQGSSSRLATGVIFTRLGDT